MTVILAFLIGLGILGLFMTNYTAHEVLEQRSQIQTEFQPYANALGVSIRHNTTILNDFTTFYEQYLPYEMPVLQFNDLAQKMLANSTSIRYIAVLPGGVYQYIYPPKENQELLGENIFRQENPRFHLSQSGLSHSTEIFGPFAPLSENNAMYLVQPVYSEEKLWGVIVLAVDPLKMITETGIDTVSGSLKIAIRNAEKTVFYGDQDVFDSTPVVIDIPVNGGHFEMGIVPVGGWYPVSSQLNIYFLPGVLVLLLACALIYSILDRHFQLEHDVRTRTEELNRELVEHTRAENRLRWVNRSLTALNQCNQLIEISSDPIELLQGACELLVEIGGYGCVWAGAAESSSEKPITLVASAGNAEDYLKGLHLTWKEAGSGLGPTGSAVRSGKVHLSEDIQQDETFYYRSEAMQAGLAAAISIPLREEDDTWGVFVAYAGSREVIDAQEQEILTTLVGNIDSAIHLMLVQADREKDEALLEQKTTNYNELADSIGEFFLTINSQGIITYCNLVALSAIQLSREQITGHSITEFPLINETGIDQAIKRVQSQLKKETLVIQTRQGDLKSYFEVNIYPTQDGVSILAKDITSQILDQWNLARYTSRLEGMRSIDQSILMARAPEEVSQEAIHLLMTFIPCDLIVITAIDSPSRQSKILCYEGRTSDFTQAQVDCLPILQLAKVSPVLSKGKPIIENGLQKHPEVDAFLKEYQKLGYDALIIAPMVLDGKLVGTIVFLSKESVIFSEQDGKIANEFATRLAVAYKQAALNEETEIRSRRLGAVSANGIAITSSMDIRVTLNVILEQICTQLGVDVAAVFLYDSATGILSGSASRGFKKVQINRLHFLLGEGMVGKIAGNQEMLYLPDIQSINDPETELLRQSGEGIVTYIACPLVSKGEIKGVLELMHRSLLSPNDEWISFMKTLATQASIAIDNAEMFDHLQRTNLELSLAYDATIEGWSRAMEMRTHEEKGHTSYLADITLEIARQLNVPPEEWTDIRRGVLLHDIGVMGLPDSILLKPGPLDEAEYKIVQRHPQMAFDLLSPISYLRTALEIPYNHHEYYDGSGYPRGLSGAEIPLAAQIFTLVDIWDALSSDRPFRAAWSMDRVFRYLAEQSGKRLNPLIYQAFKKIKV